MGIAYYPAGLTGADVWNTLRSIIGAEGSVGEYALMWNKINELEELEAALFIRAATLGADFTGGGAAAVTHGVRAAGFPLHTLLASGAIAGQFAGSEVIHDIAIDSRRPIDFEGGHLIFEQRSYHVQGANMEFYTGFRRGNASVEGVLPCAEIFYDQALGATWRVRSHDGVAEEETDTGIASANAVWHEWKIDVDAARVRFYIDGVLAATHQVRVPDIGLIADIMYVGTVLDTTVGAARQAYLEYTKVHN